MIDDQAQNESARRAAELAARASYGRLLALLAARTRDVAAAEDALSDSLKIALETWPRDGVPANPEAWLVQVARRRIIDSERRDRTAAAYVPEITRQIESLNEKTAAEFPDERLRLLFACAHPQVDPMLHTPLMLQTVLGLDAARIASAFLVSPSTMGQRLSRAKARIREQKLQFELPGPDKVPARLDAVLRAVYAAYNCAWEGISEPDSNPGLAGEALFLARLVAALSPHEPEALGLLALILFCESRAIARRNGEGAYVPLDLQDTALWSRAMIDEAEGTLNRASMLHKPGRFQLEAAIQSAHAERVRGGAVDWHSVVILYDALILTAPTLGARLGRAAALASSAGSDAACRAIDDLGAAGVEQHQPYWALRAHLAANTGRLEDARSCYRKATGLATDPSVRNFLLGRLAQLE